MSTLLKVKKNRVVGKRISSMYQIRLNGILDKILSKTERIAIEREERKLANKKYCGFTISQMGNLLKGSVEIIHPIQARKIQEKGKNVRKISYPFVRRQVEDILADKWGISILMFDTDGILLDGYHRMQAIINSNESLPFYCIYNVPRKMCEHIDTDLRVRSYTDALNASGIKADKKLYTLCRNIYINGDNSGTNSRLNVTRRWLVYRRFYVIAEKFALYLSPEYQLPYVVLGTCGRALEANPQNEKDILDFCHTMATGKTPKSKKSRVLENANLFWKWYSNLAKDNKTIGGKAGVVISRTLERVLKAVLDGKELDKVETVGSLVVAKMKGKRGEKPKASIKNSSIEVFWPINKETFIEDEEKKYEE